jgi:DNA uptake protein ComE-like DNA-binding protein
MNFKQLVRDYFTFSRNERRGITVLLIIIFMLAVTNKVIFKFETPGRIDPAVLDSSRVKLAALNDSVVSGSPGRKLFVFDPNQIDTPALDSLYIPEQVKRNLISYREHGGKFYSPEDIRKIYGVTERLYNQIAPFVKIPSLPKQDNVRTQDATGFVFDPNTATDDDFRRLGLSLKQITILRNYQSKCGVFKTKEDFLKIYGLTARQKEYLADLIRIETGSNAEGSSPITVREKLLVELNTVDSIRLEQLPGIGVKLSSRIVKYRELLGGFYSINQLREVYGLRDETIRKLENKMSIDESKIRKLDLNFSESGELARHPYLKAKLAKRIIQFRSRYGKITNPEVLRDSMILNLDEYNRIKPYL